MKYKWLCDACSWTPTGQWTLWLNLKVQKYAVCCLAAQRWAQNTFETGRLLPNHINNIGAGASPPPPFLVNTFI